MLSFLLVGLNKTPVKQEMNQRLDPRRQGEKWGGDRPPYSEGGRAVQAAGNIR